MAGISRVEKTKISASKKNADFIACRFNRKERKVFFAQGSLVHADGAG
ncbi:hypothetical protein [Flavobacterium circumlabens]|nr:hypothetical protein [Flavobacterium circumlabens]